MLNYYTLLDTETKKVVRESSIYESVLASACTIFNWKLKSDNVKIYKDVVNSIEPIILSAGKICFYIDNNILKCGSPTFIGNLNFLGQPSDVQIIEPDGKVHIFKDYLNNPNVLLVRNNNLSAPAVALQRYSAQKAEIDLSIVHNVVNSRYTPIVACQNSKEKALVDKALSNNKEGKPETVVIDKSFTDNGASVLNITDVNNSKNIENLSLIQETLSKRLYSLYGCNVNSSYKKAQQTTEEIHDGNNSCFIMVENMQRERMDNDVKEWFADNGINCTVELGKCWIKAWKNLITINDDDNSDEHSDVDSDEHSDDNSDDIGGCRK